MALAGPTPPLLSLTRAPAARRAPARLTSVAATVDYGDRRGEVIAN